MTLKRLMLAAASLSSSTAALAGQRIANDLGNCAGGGPAILATVNGVRASTGVMRVQSYRATASEWLQKGRWLTRIEAPARAGRMTFCIPMAEPGIYAIAIRHDANGNGKTDFTRDGAGMSNNPAVSIFNLGKPSPDRVRVQVNGRTPIAINMRYL